MRAYRSVVEQLFPWLVGTTQAWKQRLLETLEAAQASGRLSVTELGRHLPGRGTLKSKVKKMWRRLSGPQTDEHKALYRAIAHALLQGVQEPVLLVDWTFFNDSYLLCCALSHDGRALPLYIEVRPLKDYGKTWVEREWLTTLQNEILPSCRPVLCTDAGFRSDWFNDTHALDFHYIGRLAPNVHLQPANASSELWVDVDVLGLAATKTPEDLGDCLVCKSNPVQRRVVRYRGRVPRRPDQLRGPSPKGGGPGKKHRRQAQRGWMLVTSLSPEQADAEQIVAMYTLRMQVKELFRSIKSHMYGQGAGESRSHSAPVVAALWSLASVRALVLLLVGRVAENHCWHLDYQTNTAKRRVLSLPRLGDLVLKHHDLRQLTPQRLMQALLDVRRDASRPSRSMPGSPRLRKAISDLRQAAQSSAAAA